MAEGGRLDPDTWQCQLEELLALQSVYDDDFSLLAAPGVDPLAADGHLPEEAGPSGSQATGAAASTSTGGGQACWLDAEALLMAGPPPCLFEDSGPGASDCSTSDGRGCGHDGASGCAAVRPFAAEVLVHVDVPEGGLQLVLELLSPQHLTREQPQEHEQVAGQVFPREPPDEPPPHAMRLAGTKALDADARDTTRLRDSGTTAASGTGAATGGQPGEGQAHCRETQAEAAGRVLEAEGGWTPVKPLGGRGRPHSRASDGREGAGPGASGRGAGGRGADSRGRSSCTADSSALLPEVPGVKPGVVTADSRVKGGGAGPGIGGRDAGRPGRGRGRGHHGQPVHGPAATEFAAESQESPATGNRPPALRGGRGGGRGSRHSGIGSAKGSKRGSTGRSASDGTGTGSEPVSVPDDAAGPPVAATASAAQLLPAAAAPSRDEDCMGRTSGSIAARKATSGTSTPAPTTAAAAAGEDDPAALSADVTTANLREQQPENSCPSSAGPDSPEASASAAPAAPALVPFGASVQFLSPIRVTVSLPPSYPAADPPAVTLQALWLSAQQSAHLVSELVLQWEDGGRGAPVIFTWLDWLRSGALEHLGLRHQLVLTAEAAADVLAGAGAAAATAASAAAGGPVGMEGLEGLAVSLLRYSARREREKFNESNVSCSICLCEHLGARCVRLPECGDAFCTACITTHLRTQLREGAVDNMRCPAPVCRRQLPPYALQELLSPDEYERWETLTLQRTLDKMEDLVYCPRCREPCLEDKDHCTLCPKCFYSFCSLCEDSWHPGRDCMNVEARLALLEERRRGRGDEQLSATERARREINKRNELMSVAFLKATTKQCPMCHMGVEKVEGCNKITCTYCGGYFCWKCNQPIKGYDHFQQSDDRPGGCVLFEQTEIDRWNARWRVAPPNVVQAEQRRLMVNLLPRNGAEVRVCNCVVCGQRNLKEGNNNNVRCRSCNSHFCYLCRTWLRTKPGLHFGPGRCKQHSED